MSFGSFAGSAAARATSCMVNVRLVFGLEKIPSAKLTSPASTPSRWAASVLALAMIFSTAPWNADPASVAERDPPVPWPKKTLSVSPCTYSA